MVSVINFIVCEDSKVTRKKIENLIDEVMMENDNHYTKHVYDDYNKSFDKEILNCNMANKIYILDVYTPSRSGIDVAREIREKDTNSIIIFLTGDKECGQIILEDDLMYLSFIVKNNNSDSRLKSTINKSLKIIGNKRVLKFKNKGIIYTIPHNDILYITRDTYERKCIIKTECNEFKVSKNLNELSSMLGSKFIETHRSCYINIDRKIFIDKKNKIIKFDNGLTIDLVSKAYKESVEA